MQKILFFRCTSEEKLLHNCIRTFIAVYNNKNVGKSGHIEVKEERKLDAQSKKIKASTNVLVIWVVWTYKCLVLHIIF